MLDKQAAASESASTPSIWPLGSFYWFYFAILGTTVPYFALYLESLNFSPQQIGLLMSLLLASKIIGPNFWGYVVDRQHNRPGSGKHRSLIAALIAALLCFSLLNVIHNIWLIAVVMLVYSFFWNAVLPQIEAMVYNTLGDRRYRYGLVRLWGSIGFIVLVVLMGMLLDHYGIQVLIPSMTLLFAILLLNGLLVSRTAPEAGQQTVAVSGSGNFTNKLTPGIVFLLVLCTLSQLCHAPFYTFFSIYLEGYGYSKTLIGWLWAWGVIAEVFVFLGAHILLQRCKLSYLLALCFAAGAVRWWLLASFADSTGWLIASQTLHAITFGLYHVTVSQMINAHFQGRSQVRGQALYSSMTYGVGGAIGTFASGFIWARMGGENLFYLASGLMVLVGLIAVVAIASKRWQPAEPQSN